MSFMSGSGGISDRIARLETWREEVNRRLDNIERTIDDLKDQFFKMQTNELEHVNQRILDLENRKRDPIDKTDLAKIIIAMITTAGLVLAAYIQFIVR